MVEQTELEEIQEVPQMSAEDRRREHYAAKSGLQKLIDSLKRKGAGEATPEKFKNLIKDDRKKLEKTGVNVEYVPDAVKEVYVKVYNLVRSPETRFEKNKQGIDGLVGEMEGISKDINDKLYGTGYTGTNGKLGGLHKEYMQLADNRLNCATAINTLDEEVNQTYQRIKDTEKNRKEKTLSTSPAEFKKINEDLIGYKFDLGQYKKIKRDLETQLISLDDEVKTLQYEIKKLEHLEGYIEDQTLIARGALRNNIARSNENSYTKTIATVIPDIQKRLNEYLKMDNAFRDHNDQTTTHIIDITNVNLKIGEREQRSSPFEDYKRHEEERSDEIGARVKEILDKPFDDIYPEMNP